MASGTSDTGVSSSADRGDRSRSERSSVDSRPRGAASLRNGGSSSETISETISETTTSFPSNPSGDARTNEELRTNEKPRTNVGPKTMERLGTISGSKTAVESTVGSEPTLESSVLVDSGATSASESVRTTPSSHEMVTATGLRNERHPTDGSDVSHVSMRNGGKKCRFLLSSDLHLEQPPYIPDDAPAWLRNRLLHSARFRLERLVDAAIAQRVDAVLIAGDLLHPERSGPRALLFVLEQFERLAARRIPVYWAGGEMDTPDRWPDAESLRLPDNIHVFPTGHFRTFVLSETDSRCPVRFVGVSQSAGHRRAPRLISIDPFPVASSHSSANTSKNKENIGELDYTENIGVTITASVEEAKEATVSESTESVKEMAEIGATIVLLRDPEAPRVIRHRYFAQLEKAGTPVHFWALGGRHRRGLRRLKVHPSQRKTFDEAGTYEEETNAKKEKSGERNRGIKKHSRPHGTSDDRTDSQNGRSTASLPDSVLHDPGTPQGQRPEQVGIHGISLVEISPSQRELRRRVRVSLLPTDPIRWLTEEVRLESGVSRANVEQRLRERLRHILELTAETSIMVTWRLLADALMVRALRRGFAEELLEILRSDARRANVLVRSDSTRISSSEKNGNGKNEKNDSTDRMGRERRKNGDRHVVSTTNTSSETPSGTENSGNNANEFVWNVAIEPVLVGPAEKILIPGKESMLRDYLAGIDQIRGMAFPEGVPYDADFDAPLIPETFSDTENDFDPENDQSLDHDASSLEPSVVSEPTKAKATELPFDRDKIAEQFPLLDEYLEFVAKMESEPEDSNDDLSALEEGSSTERFTEDTEDREISSETESTSRSPDAVDPVLWRTWLGQVAQWDEDPHTFRTMLREASLLGVDLLDSDDDLFARNPSSDTVERSPENGDRSQRGEAQR